MRGNGNGGNGHESGEVTQADFDAALAALGAPRDRVDRIAAFAASQCNALLQMINAQSDATSGMIKLLNERFSPHRGRDRQAQSAEAARSAH
jgi:hypothetical protein